MRSRIVVGLGLLGCLVAGCVTEQVSRKGVATRVHREAPHEQGGSLADSLRLPWNGATRGKQPAEWDWATAVPSSVPRAEVLRPTLPATSLAVLVPEFENQKVVLASAGREPSPFIIAGVAGHSVKHCNQLNDEVERVVAAGKPAEVTLLAADATADSSPTSVNVEPSVLVALSQAAAPNRR